MPCAVVSSYPAQSQCGVAKGPRYFLFGLDFWGLGPYIIGGRQFLWPISLTVWFLTFLDPDKQRVMCSHCLAYLSGVESSSADPVMYNWETGGNRLGLFIWNSSRVCAGLEKESSECRYIFSTKTAIDLSSSVVLSQQKINML